MGKTYKIHVNQSPLEVFLDIYTHKPPASCFLLQDNDVYLKPILQTTP